MLSSIRWTLHKCVQQIRNKRFTPSRQAPATHNMNVSGHLINMPNPDEHRQQNRTNAGAAFVACLPAGIWSFLAPRISDEDDPEATPEGKLIMCLKRSILCIQRQQYDKAEQMLHLALRMAQDQQSAQGITYCFDVMANLALETEQFTKAKRLFVTVMQRLLQSGLTEDDIKMLHISSKLAQLEALQGNWQTAELGFKWVLQKIREQLTKCGDEMRSDLQELSGLTMDCYAQMLMQVGRFVEAKPLFADALAVFAQLHGRDQPEAVAMLNNLAVVCTNLDDLIGAEAYIIEALQLAQKFPALFESGVYQANHGMVLLKRGMLAEAERVCAAAWRSAKRAESKDGIKQADYCLQQVRQMRMG